MATTWQALVQRAYRRYGVDPLAEEATHYEPLLLDRCNEILREFGEYGGFREEFTLNLSGSSAVHALSTRVQSVIEDTVRVDYDGSGNYTTEPELVDEQELRRAYGVLENAAAGCPLAYYTQRGSAADALLSLVVYPRSDTARTNGIKLWARVDPTVVALTDNVPLQANEEALLIPGLVLALAEADLRQGRVPASIVQVWDDRWNVALARYADRVEDSLRAGRRRVHQVLNDLD